MSRNKFSKKEKQHEIEELLDCLVLKRDTFVSSLNTIIWKSAYLSIYAIENLINIHLKNHHWKNFSEIENSLKKLKKTSTKFIKKVRKKGSSHGVWKGSGQDCSQIFKIFQDKCKPEIIQIYKNLDEQNQLRINVENKII